MTIIKMLNINLCQHRIFKTTKILKKLLLKKEQNSKFCPNYVKSSFFGGEQLLVFHFPKWNIQTSSKIIFCLSRPVEFEMIQYVCAYAAHTSFSHTTAITIYQCKQNAFTLNYRLESITIQLGLALFSLSMK